MDNIHSNPVLKIFSLEYHEAGGFKDG